ncbi:MAG TPA: hypothetical protein VN253_16250, partial [Kofleriaceae bacterium]|nr:hypothetical protein [Kofleriaceae bacterium]
GQIFVWGGTPTGAWGAEPAARAPGSSATVMGDTRPPTRDWSGLLEEYEDITRAIAQHSSASAPPDLVRRKQQIEAQIADAHGGMALRRNRKPGATYEHGIRGGDVRIAFGTPSKISPTQDGRVLVTIGTGVDARSTLYDQVVIAHGQDPGAPGAPGALLGRGATSTGVEAGGHAAYGEVPEGTIALRPIYGPARDGLEPEVLGLESIDPPGIRLIGASYATRRLSPWVAQRERGRFERALEQMAAEHAPPTRDHGPISADSTKVTTAIERQRDQIPRANEVLAAKAYRLPGPEQTLELDRANPARWDEQVREFFAIHLRANGQWVRVERLGGGRSRAVVYRVWVDGSDVGVFKLFDGRGGAATEQKMLELLRNAKLTKLTAVRERGRIGVDPRTGLEGGGLLMDAAKGTSIRELIEHLPSDPALHDTAMKQLNFAMKRAAEGLAEMHAKFETRGQGGAPKMMSREAKLSDANYFLDKNFRDGEDVSKVKIALGEGEFARVKAALEGLMLQRFLEADVPATAYHGDANAGNFIVHDYDAQSGYKELGLIDVGSMSWSIDARTGKGTKTGAADVARFLGSLETLHPGKLTPGEVRILQDTFMKKYLQQYRADAHRDLDGDRYRQAENWYRLEMEIAALKAGVDVKSRIMRLLGLEMAP